MKIPETSANAGNYYGNEENGPWPGNGMVMDGSMTGGGVVGGGDAGYVHPAAHVYPVPRPHMPNPGYVVPGAYYPGYAGVPQGAMPAPPAPAPGPMPDDFADYMWMENEEEFDKQVMQQLEEEALMEQCIEAMLEDERERGEEGCGGGRPTVNGHRSTTGQGSGASNGVRGASLDEQVSKSTLNPLAAEFVPTFAPRSAAAAATTNTQEKSSPVTVVEVSANDVVRTADQTDSKVKERADTPPKNVTSNETVAQPNETAETPTEQPKKPEGAAKKTKADPKKTEDSKSKTEAKKGDKRVEKDTTRDAVKSTKDATKSEKDSVKSVKDVTKSEKDSAKSFKDAAKSEKDSMKSEKASTKSEKDSVKSDKDSVKSAKDTAKPEKEVVKVVKVAVKSKSDSKVAAGAPGGKKEVRGARSEGKLEGKEAEVASPVAEMVKSQPMSGPEPMPASTAPVMKPINYAAAARANKPKKPSPTSDATATAPAAATARKNSNK